MLLPRRRLGIDPGKAALVAAFVLGLLLFFSVLRASLFGSVPADKRFWFELTFLLAAAVLSEVLVLSLKQSSAISLLVVGALLSQSSLDVMWPAISGFLSSFNLAGALPLAAPRFVSFEGTLRVFAQLGAVFLLFSAGMHSKVEEIFNAKNLFVAAFGVILPFFGGFLYTYLSGGAFVSSLFFGAALTATSVGVTVSLMAELGVLHKPFAKTILGAAVIDDILALVMLSLVQNAGGGSAAGSIGLVLMALVSAAVFIAGGIAVGWFLARQYIDPGAAADENRAFLLSLALVFFYAYVAEFIGLSAIVGAFVAGIVLSQLSFAPRLLELFHPLGELFTPLFFLSLGMFIDVRTLVPALVPILIVIVIVFVTKIVGAGTAAALSGSSPADALRVGVGMVPRGEISLVIALLGLQSGVLDALQYSVISAMAFATTILAPLLLRPLVRR